MARNIDRRSFLQRSGATGLAMSLAGSAGSRASASPLTSTSSLSLQESRANNEVVVGYLEEPDRGLTAIWRGNTTGIQIGSQLFETLTKVSNYETLELEPNLAEEWTQEDDTTYVFKLREGVQFHEGYGELTAEDAAWSINIGLEDEGTAGARSYLAGATARDKYTFEVKLQAPFGGFLTTWSHIWYSTVHCKAAYEELGHDEYLARGIGTGPFRLEEWNRGVSISLVRFEDYWDPERPKLDRLTFLPVADPFVKLERLRAGELDLIDAINFLDLPQLEESPELKLLTPPGDAWDYICFNLRLPEDHPLRSTEVRQAVGYAVNRNEIAELVYHGYAQPADHPFIPGLPGYDEDLNYYPLDGDPDMARQLLEEAGYADGFEVSCITSAKQHLRDELLIVAGQLADVGITINIQELDTGTFNERERTTHDYEMSLEDISLSGPDADATVYWFHHSEEDTYSGYSNPEVDRLLDEARAEGDPERRHELYQSVMEIIYQDSPMLYLVQPPQVWVMNSGLDGFRIGRTEFNIYFDELHWTE